MLGCSSRFAAFLTFLVVIGGSWGRTLQQTRELARARQSQIYTDTAWLRDLLLRSPLIPSALPAAQRHFSAKEYLRPKSDWDKPQTDQQPSDVKIFIGVITAARAPGADPKYDYTARRNMIRSSWMRVAQRYRHMAVKFIVGMYSDPEKQASIEQEHREYGDFMTLTEVDDRYDNLTNKTRYFFRNVFLAYPAVEYIVKMDDDVLIFPDRLPMIADQWYHMKADYIGCANRAKRQTSPKFRWYDPDGYAVGKGYPLYFLGSIYVLSGRIVRDVLMLNFDELRAQQSPEDTTVSLWMLASDAVYFEDRRLCRLTCDKATVAMSDQDEQGFPMKYWSMALNDEGCTRAPKFPLPYVPVQFRKYPGLEKMHDLMI